MRTPSRGVTRRVPVLNGYPPTLGENVRVLASIHGHFGRIPAYPFNGGYPYLITPTWHSSSRVPECPGSKYSASMECYPCPWRVLASRVMHVSSRVIGKRVTPILWCGARCKARGSIFILKRVSWRICTKYYPGHVIQEMISYHLRDFQGKSTGTPSTRVPAPKILGEYEVLPVPVTGVRKPGNTR